MFEPGQPLNGLSKTFKGSMVRKLKMAQWVHWSILKDTSFKFSNWPWWTISRIQIILKKSLISYRSYSKDYLRKPLINYQALKHYLQKDPYKPWGNFQKMEVFESSRWINKLSCQIKIWSFSKFHFRWMKHWRHSK
jgi:hypothetical protein